MIHKRVCAPGAGVAIVGPTAVVVFVSGGATVVVGAGARVVEFVDELDDVEVVDDVVDDGGGKVVVVVGARVTVDDVVGVWA